MFWCFSIHSHCFNGGTINDSSPHFCSFIKMERNTIQGTTQDEIKKTHLGEFHLYTFQTNKIQAWKIKKFKQYFLAIVSYSASFFHSLHCKFLTQFPCNLHTSQIIECAVRTPPKPFPHATCWALLGHLPILGRRTRCSWVPVGELCSQSRSAQPVGLGHLPSCWANTENQSGFSQRPSYSLLLRGWQEELSQTCCLSEGLGVVPHWLAQELWPWLWPSHRSEHKPGSGSVTKHEVQLHRLQLTEQIQYRASCPSVRERSQCLPKAVQLTLPQRGVSCRKVQSFFRATHFPKFIGETARTTCSEGSHLSGVMLQLY